MVVVTGLLLSFLAALGTRVEPAVTALLGPVGHHRVALFPSLSRRLAGLPVLRRVARADTIATRLRACAWPVALDDVIAVKVLAAASVVVLVLALSPSALPVAVLAAGGAYVIPDLVLARAARARIRRADAELPLFLDLLAAASSAGLAAPAAIKRASAGLRGPLSDELASATASVEVGGRWREELRAIADRLQLGDLSLAVTAIARTESLGSSLAESMHELAEDVREARRSRAAERARKAPVKMLFPLVFMILPAFLLLTVVPVLIATLRSLK